MTVTHRAGLTPVISKTHRATRLCSCHFSIAMAITSPPIKSMLVSFRYSRQTCKVEQGRENSDRKLREKAFSEGGSCSEDISMQ